MNTRTLSRLVKQQFWLFGWDIRRPAGNLLMELGFQRTRNPDGAKAGSTRYHQILPGGDIVTLWGFGLCWSSPDRGSIYVSRLKPQVLYTARSAFIPESWYAQVAHEFHKPETAYEHAVVDDLTLELLAWVADYETTVLQSCGDAYRREAIAAWRDPFGNPASVISMWRDLHELLASRLVAVSA